MGIYRMKRDLDVCQSALVPDCFRRAQHGIAEPKPNRKELCSSPAQVVLSLAQLNKRKMRDRFKVSEYGSKPLINDQDVRRMRPRPGIMGAVGYCSPRSSGARRPKRKKGCVSAAVHALPRVAIATQGTSGPSVPCHHAVPALLRPEPNTRQICVTCSAA